MKLAKSSNVIEHDLQHTRDHASYKQRQPNKTPCYSDKIFLQPALHRRLADLQTRHVLFLHSRWNSNMLSQFNFRKVVWLTCLVVGLLTIIYIFLSNFIFMLFLFLFYFTFQSFLFCFLIFLPSFLLIIYFSFSSFTKYFSSTPPGSSTSSSLSSFFSFFKQLSLLFPPFHIIIFLYHNLSSLFIIIIHFLLKSSFFPKKF